MIPVFSQATLLPHPLGVDLDACIKGGVRAVELWLTKAEEHLKQHKPSDLVKRFSDAGIGLVSASYQGGLLGGTPESRASHLDHFKRRLDLCQALGINTLGLLPDLQPAGGRPGAERVNEAEVASVLEQLGSAADWADAYGVRLALSFRMESPLPTNLQTAIALVEAAERPNLGLALDCFPFFNGPSKTEELGLILPGKLFLVRVCDMPATLRELARESDTILPGDGEWPLEPLIHRLKEKGYDGPVSVEVRNPRLWQVKPSQLAELAWSSVLRLLGQKEKLHPNPVS